MPVNMHIRDLDERTHRELVRRADAAGMSLRAYVIDILHRHTALPTLAGWLDDVRAAPPLPGQGPDSVTLVEEGRDDAEVLSASDASSEPVPLNRRRSGRRSRK